MKIPKHVGFIMDGNGRWAKLRGKPRTFGHQKGADAIYNVVNGCYKRDIKAVSLYAFSTENWSRPKEEVDKIFDLLAKFLKKYTKTLIKHEARLNISGDKSQLPERLVKEIDKVIEKTNHFTQKTLNIALNYGSRTEIVRAVNNIIKEGVSDISEEEFSKYLYTANLPDVDLIVRTSGESRLSNFLLYQSAYAELYFTDVLWPDFSEEELDKALVWYDGRDRRYGNIK
ncbi:MAG: di-trans,poly-cis-decaprenylcistransferase [Clostridia bacterium]|nr:di-trans,poly-cis-decaprenylcistransferase [Clostridia bacterium]